MKMYSKFLVMVAFVATACVMTSCTEDGEKEPPLLTVSQNLSNEEVIEFKVKCLVQGDASSLASLEILLDGQPAHDAVLKKQWTGKDTKTTTGALSGKQEDVVASFDNGVAGKSLKFTLTDKDGASRVVTMEAKAVKASN